MWLILNMMKIFFSLSLWNFKVYLHLTTHLSLDKPQFKCSVWVVATSTGQHSGLEQGHTQPDSLIEISWETLNQLSRPPLILRPHISILFVPLFFPANSNYREMLGLAITTSSAVFSQSWQLVRPTYPSLEMTVQSILPNVFTAVSMIFFLWGVTRWHFPKPGWFFLIHPFLKTHPNQWIPKMIQTSSVPRTPTE